MPSTTDTEKAVDDLQRSMSVVLKTFEGREAAIANDEEKAKKVLEQAQLDAKNVVKKATEKSKKIASTIAAEKQAWEAEKEKVAKTCTFDTIIKLNVGGTSFATSLTTLTRVPESMLASMFSGRHALQKMDDGAYFIDRDGTHFRYILNYLRDPEHFSFDVITSSQNACAIIKEMEYYLIDVPGSLLSKDPSQRSSQRSPWIAQDQLWHARFQGHGDDVIAVCESCGDGKPQKCDLSQHNQRRNTSSMIHNQRCNTSSMILTNFRNGREIPANQPMYKCLRCSGAIHHNNQYYNGY